MKLVDMKNVEGSDDSPQPVAYERPDYPYGLKLCLSDAVLDALGIEELPKLGAEIVLTAKVRVTAVSSREVADDADQSMDLQITEMALAAPKDPAKIAKEMYGE